MIAFATVVAEPEPYERFAGPGIARAAEADSDLIVLASVHPAARSLNLALDAAARHEDLEALVIVDAFTELLDEGFCEEVRSGLAQPDAAVLGVAGASRFRGTAWWEGEVRAVPIEHRYREFGGGSKPAFPWLAESGPPGAVDAVNEMVLALSPWAVHNLRFDEELHLRHGLEIDICHQARAAGRRVYVAPFSVRYHGPLAYNADRRQIQIWEEAHVALAGKWIDDPTPGDPDSEDWKQRARRAEAEREASRAFSYPLDLALEAERERLESEMEGYTSSLGWKVTRPLRLLNARRHKVKARRHNGSDG